MLDSKNAVICVLIRIFSGSSMNRTETARSPSSAPLKPTSPVKLGPLQRSPRSRQQTATQGTLLNPKRMSQHRAAAYLLWRRRHAGQRPSSPSKIHTTSIVTLARYSQWHFLLSISSIGFIISFFKLFSLKLPLRCFRQPDASLSRHLRPIPVATAWTQSCLYHQTGLRSPTWAASVDCLLWLFGIFSLIWLQYIFSTISWKSRNNTWLLMNLFWFNVDIVQNQF